MCNIEKIELDDKYLVRDKSSSDGSQVKYYCNNTWYKIDYYGGEAESECLAALLLECTNMRDDQYVKYNRILLNTKPACASTEFRKDPENEEFITFYRLYKNIYGRDLAAVTSRMDFDDAIEYVIKFVHEQVGLDVRNYLANTFWLDAIILNTDRHFNNYGVIFGRDGFKEAPIFDNGKSLLTGSNLNLRHVNIEDAVKNVHSKSFSPDFRLNYSYLKKYCSIELNLDRLSNELSKCPMSDQKLVLEHQLKRCI